MPSTSATRRERLGRAKPWTSCGVSAGRPSRARISSRTTGVAVAVHASARASRQVSEQAADLEILRPEVVSPLADAVRFVDGHERTAQIGEEAAEAGEAQPLRGDVDQLVVAPGHQAHAPAHLAAVHGGGEIRRGHAAGAERLHLIVHQRDQGRDDEGRAVEQRGGKLIDEALAAAGGGHEEESAGGEQRVDGLALAGTKGGVAQPGEPRVEIETRRGRRLGRAARDHLTSRTASATRRGCDRGSWPTSRSRWDRRPW